MLVDDHVPHHKALWEITTKSIDPKFYSQRRPYIYTIKNLIVYIFSCLAIHQLWGFVPALLFAVHPLNCEAGCWSVGGFYMKTVLFLLTGHYLLLTFEYGYLASPIFYYTAMHSSVTAIPYAIYIQFLDIPVQVKIIHILVMLLFLVSPRFRHGLKIRKESHEDKGVKGGRLSIRNVLIAVKVVGYNLYWMIWPSRLGFFSDFGKHDDKDGKLENANRTFWLMLCLILVISSIMIQIDWEMWLWVMLFLGIHSQIMGMYGMFVAERYTRIALIGFVVIVARLIHILCG